MVVLLLFKNLAFMVIFFDQNQANGSSKLIAILRRCYKKADRNINDFKVKIYHVVQIIWPPSF